MQWLSEMSTPPAKRGRLDAIGVGSLGPRPRPQLVVLDLDQTMWPFDAAQPRYGLPHHASPPGVQCTATVAKAFSEAVAVVRELKAEASATSRVRLAVASANSQAKVCCSLLRHLGLLQELAGGGGIEEELMEIYGGCSKTVHLRRIFEKSAVPFSEMLFFDDAPHNIRAAERLGVVARRVAPSEGLTRKAFAAGLAAWSEQRASRRAMASWLRPSIRPSSCDEDPGRQGANSTPAAQVRQETLSPRALEMNEQQPPKLCPCDVSGRGPGGAKVTAEAREQSRSEASEQNGALTGHQPVPVIELS